jgi:transposase
VGRAVVLVAMELSKSAWLLAAQGSPSGKTSSHRLEGGDVDGLLALLRRLREREERACGGGEARVVLGYEAGRDGFWLQRRLAATGIACWVMDPASLQVDRRARRAKTDRLEAAMLLRALTACAAATGRPAAWCGCPRRSGRTPGAPTASASG